MKVTVEKTYIILEKGRKKMLVLDKKGKKYKHNLYEEISLIVLIYQTFLFLPNGLSICFKSNGRVKSSSNSFKEHKSSIEPDKL